MPLVRQAGEAAPGLVRHTPPTGRKRESTEVARLVTEFPEAQPLTDLKDQPLPSRGTPVGRIVRFVTKADTYVAIGVMDDPATERARLQVFNKRASGSSLSPDIRHISSGDVPCWAWPDEAPPDGIPSAPKPERRRAHTSKSVGGIRV